MDGMNIKEQVRLLRSVIGRKVMEIDDFDSKAAGTIGEDVEKYLNVIEFLNNDIAGYKTIVEDLSDGSRDMTGNIYDIASLPPESAEIYTGFYLPSLSDDDREEEELAMGIKTQYATDLAKEYIIHVGRVALMDPDSLEVILADEDIMTLIGNAILDSPRIMEALGRNE